MGRGGITFVEFLGCMHRSHHDGAPTEFSEFVDAVDAKVNATNGQNLTYVFLMCTFLVLVSSSTALFEYFQCQNFPESDPPVSFLIRDYSVDCLSNRYNSYTIYALVMLMVRMCTLSRRAANFFAFILLTAFLNKYRCRFIRLAFHFFI